MAVEATKTALARADAIANATGLKVVRIEQINVASEEAVIPVPFPVAKMKAPAPTRAIETETGRSGPVQRSALSGQFVARLPITPWLLFSNSFPTTAPRKLGLQPITNHQTNH